MKRICVLLLFLLLLLAPVKISHAQDQQPVTGPVYIVESGDTFYSIALKFGLTVDDLTAANPQIDPNMLSIGMEVTIPGLEGVQGKLVTQTVQLGDNLRSLSIRNQIEQGQVAQLNHLTSPAEAYAGANLIIPQNDQRQPLESDALLGENQSLFQAALKSQQNPWLTAEMNQYENSWDVLPGEVIFGQSAEGTTDLVNPISPVIKDISINPLPILQGETAVVKITTTEPVNLSGVLAGNELHFFSTTANEYIALQGIYVMADPGIYPFSISGTLAGGEKFSFEQMLIMKALGYVQEKIDGVNPETIDPAVTKPEDDQVRAVISKDTDQKLWDGIFSSPAYDPNWITSTFGNRRSYNGGPFIYFHSGLDYGSGIGLPVKAPAPGIVVFAGPLTVRGNATIIDHGWGVFSGLWHQSEFKVQVGDRVETGQVIGLTGGTGRITGPHLHWEIWVNGVQVDPYTWLQKSFP
jgi:murein DD-endopeptidase MepM/ murein hydrolase activator NlpD